MHRKTTDPALAKKPEKVRSKDGRKIYRIRKETVEPVFGIITSVIGLGRFLRREFEAVNAEWNLVCVAYNMKRLWRLCTAGPPKPRLIWRVIPPLGTVNGKPRRTTRSKSGHRWFLAPFRHPMLRGKPDSKEYRRYGASMPQQSRPFRHEIPPV